MSETNFPVLAENISALTPLDETTHQVLDQYGVDEQTRQQYADRFSRHTTEQLARLELALALSRPQVLDPVVGYDNEVALSENYRDLDLKALGINESSVDQKTLHREAREYEAIMHNPSKKLSKDGEWVLNFLRGLGVTNALRTPEGYDAVFELGSMRRLLQRDYESVARHEGAEEVAYQIDTGQYKGNDRPKKPESQESVSVEAEQFKPELRFAEALVAEQMALLWRPKAVGELAKFPDAYRDLIANPNDPNVFSEEDISSRSVGEKWCLIGAQQCYEVATLFKNIYHSKTAPEILKIQCLSRWIDMEIRGRLIERILAGPDDNKKLERSIHRLTNTQAERALHYQERFIVQRRQREREFNRHNPGRRYEPTQEDKDLSAAAFESVVLAVERKRLLQRGVYGAYVRLAMPGEDQIHQNIRPLIVNGNLKLNLSSDVIQEGLDGTRITAYQAKAMPEEAFRDISGQEEQRTGVRAVYPPKIINERFTNSDGYPRG